MRLLVAVVCLGLFVLPAGAGEIDETVTKLKLSKEYLLELGKIIYETEGANTCLKCHGPGGTGGDQAGAADLRHPRTWRVYQAMGGDAAFKANKEKFLKDVDLVIHDLIRNGATTWNLRFVKAHKDIPFDWAKVSEPAKADKYDAMMKGLTSDTMAKGLKDVQEKLTKDGKKVTPQELKDIAAVADFMHVKTFDDGSDKGGVFK